MTTKNTLWLLPFIFFVVGFFTTRSFFHVQQFPVPSVVGMTLHEAFATLSNHNLSIRLTDQKIDPNLADGTILNQTPTAGLMVKPRQTVFLAISRCPQPSETPDFVGKELQEIIQQGKDRSIKIKHYYLPSIYPAGSCIAQYPGKGKSLDQSGITVYIASEMSYSFIWPNFIGKPLSHVTDFLDQHGITPQITIDPSSQIVDPIVIDQRPLAGSIVSMVKNQLPIVQISAQ